MSTERVTRLAVVIVTWNSASEIDGCLASVVPQLGPSDEIVVVDNASGDGTADLVAMGHPTVTLVRSHGNIGFAPACNIGLGHTSAGTVLFLNPDARLAPGALDLMLDELTDPTVGVVGPRLVGPDGASNDYAARRRPSAWRTWCRLIGLARLDVAAMREGMASGIGCSSADVPCVSGAALMVRRAVLEERGGLDVSMPMYFEDLELCERARLSGWKVRFAGNAVAEHAGGASSDRSAHRKLLMAMEDAHAPWRFILRFDGRAAATRHRAAVGFGSLVRVVALAPLRAMRRDSPPLRDIAARAGALLRWSITSPATFDGRIVAAFDASRPTGSQAMKVSVLVHNRDRANALDRCLASIEAQTHRPLQVVIHDASSIDDSWEVIDRWADKMRCAGIEVIAATCERRGVAASRNALAESADGELLLIIDNDAELESPTTIAAAARRHADELDLAVTSARVTLGDGPGHDPMAWVFRRDVSTWWHVGFDTFTFAGTAAFIRGDVFRRLGGFWSVLPYGREEEELAYAILDDGGRLAYSPTVAIRHHPSEIGRMSMAARRRVELRNGAMVLWRRLPLVVAVPAITARSVTSVRRARREDHAIAPVLGGLRDAVRMWRADDCRRRPISWHAVRRLLVLQRPATAAGRDA